MKRVYLAHPLGGTELERANNLFSAKKWLRWIYENFRGICPVAGWILCCEILDDSNPEHRKHGITCNDYDIKTCNEVWLVGGRVSPGMEAERQLAIKLGTKVQDLTFLGRDPPESIPDNLLEHWLSSPSEG